MAKSYEELTFADDFMFCKIMESNQDLCRELTELILGRKIGGILTIDKQKPIEVTADGRGVRFDIYMMEDDQTVYNITTSTDGDGYISGPLYAFAGDITSVFSCLLSIITLSSLSKTLV